MFYSSYTFLKEHGHKNKRALKRLDNLDILKGEICHSESLHIRYLGHDIKLIGFIHVQ